MSLFCTLCRIKLGYRSTRFFEVGEEYILRRRCGVPGTFQRQRLRSTSLASGIRAFSGAPYVCWAFRPMVFHPGPTDWDNLTGVYFEIWKYRTRDTRYGTLLSAAYLVTHDLMIHFVSQLQSPVSNPVSRFKVRVQQPAQQIAAAGVLIADL